MRKSNILTREQAIDQLLERVNDWDIEVLLQVVQDDYLERLSQCSDEELESEYNHEFGLFDTDNEEESLVKIVNTKASKLLLDKEVRK